MGELFPRVGFIVTNLAADNRAVVRFYNKRGTAERWIKEGKQAVALTRLSCHRFRANEVRLWLSVIAYNLGNLWRRLALPAPIGKWSLTSLQQRLVKTGGRLIQHARYYWLMLAESHLTRRLFADMLRKVAALPMPAGRRVQSGANLDDGAGLAGEVSADAPGKRVLSGRCVLAGGETGAFRHCWEHRGGKCCNFGDGDEGCPAPNSAVRSQAASSNRWSMN